MRQATGKKNPFLIHPRICSDVRREDASNRSWIKDRIYWYRYWYWLILPRLRSSAGTKSIHWKHKTQHTHTPSFDYTKIHSERDIVPKVTISMFDAGEWFQRAQCPKGDWRERDHLNGSSPLLNAQWFDMMFVLILMAKRYFQLGERTITKDGLGTIKHLYRVYIYMYTLIYSYTKCPR